MVIKFIFILVCYFSTTREYKNNENYTILNKKKTLLQFVSNAEFYFYLL